MSKIFMRFKYPALLFALFLLAECLVNPLGEFPLNDDWSYAKSVYLLQFENKLNIGNWAAMTLVSHLLWGLLFTKSFGFSFVVLRFSTLISSLIGIFGLYHLSWKLSGSRRTAFLAGMSLCFTPLYFNLSNTYMTDVNFTSWFVLFTVCTYYLIRENKTWMIFPIILISFMLVFMRQYGIIAPLSIAASSFFAEKRRALLFWSGTICTALTFFALQRYEQDLATYLGWWSPYKFSGRVSFTDVSFYEILYLNSLVRYKTILVQVLVYVFPFLCFYLPALIKSYSKRQLQLRAFLAILICIWVCDGADFPTRPVVLNMSIGMETFYQSWGHNIPQHNSFAFFPFVAAIVKYLFVGGSSFWLMLQLFRTRTPIEKAGGPFIAFCACLFALYVFMLLITDSFFDRYHLPLIALALVYFSELSRSEQGSFSWGSWAFVLMSYCAVAGTHDYLLYNTKRWEAYRQLKASGIPSERINAGFEVNCWNEGKESWWTEFESLKNYDYLIQFDAESGFRLYEEFPFRRYYPPKDDKINIFVREGVVPSAASNSPNLR